ncbi:MAG: SPFH domain-containing protein [Defluviitaleaceae bacterium]|nr:SPFH domain-containing protein [Defluviitaleaceae bacterium]MCL2274278.1 SPFH domain-containing protein [Defluviitaleaceae bacterium]
MSLFNRKNSGTMDVIRCDEPSYLIWKWHPAGFDAGNNKRENAIRYGSSLRVKEGEVAILVYAQADGTEVEYAEGPCNRLIESANFPILASIVGLAYAGGSPFQAEVYFINLATVIQTPFAVPFFDVFDPRFSDFSVPIAIRGRISFNITDYQEFIKLHRLINFDLATFQTQIRDATIKYVKSVVANIPSDKNIPVIQIERQIEQISNTVEEQLRYRLMVDFGVSVTGIDISTVEVDKTSNGYMQLMRVTQDVATATVQAQTEAAVRDIQDKQRIHAKNLQETLRMQREEGQYSQRKQTQMANFAAYQTEAQAEVGVAGANALGQMCSNDTGSVSGEGGFNPAIMIAGMAVGGAMGQNIAGTMNNMMTGVRQPSGQAMPPPIPKVVYNVALNDKSAGPFDLDTLSQMILVGTLARETLVWKNGMANWEKAGDVHELQSIFSTLPPPLPSAK